MNKKCSRCGAQKAKRFCLRPAHEMICPRCCASIRNAECKGCGHYETAEEYRLNKSRNPGAGVGHFVAEINEEAEAAVDRALDFVERGDIETGRVALLGLLEKYPRNHTVHFGLGVAHARKKRYDEAIACFEKATEIFPYFAQAHFNKGVAYEEMLEPSKALRAFREAVATGNPKENYVREAVRFLADREKSLRKKDGVDLDTYLEGEEIFNDAFSCMQRKEWGRALDGFARVLAKNKNHVQSHGNMGICYAQLGRKQEALAALDRSLELDPGYNPALINRAVIANAREGGPLREGEIKMAEVAYYRDSFLRKEGAKRNEIKNEK